VEVEGVLTLPMVVLEALEEVLVIII